VTEALVSGKRVRIDVNPREGFKMVVNGTPVFYIDNTGTAVFTGKVTIGSGTDYESGYDPTLIEVGGRNLALGTEIDAWYSPYSANTTVYRSSVDVTNLVTNGNFVNATGWSTPEGSLSVANNTATQTSNGSQTYARIIRTDSTSTVGHTYALTLRVRVTNSSCISLSASIYNSTGVTIQATPVANQWYQLTVLQTITNAQAYIWIVHNYATATIANGQKMEVQYVSCVDLTAHFPADVPTQSVYARWIVKQPNAWIDGTANTKGMYRTNSIKGVGKTTTTGVMGVAQTAPYQSMQLTAGTTYNLSFLARGNVPLNYVYIMNSGTNQNIGMNQALTSSFVRVSKTFVADTNTGASTGSYLMVAYSGSIVALNSWFEIQEVKIEAGNKATDWCPDTLDMAFPDTTTIDGGNIKTGKIESHDGKTYFNLDNDEIVMDGGANGKVKINPTVGFQMLNDSDVQIGGTATIEGELASIASILTDDATSPAFWAKIGTEGLLKGIIGYLRGFSTTDPAFSVTSGGITTNPFFQIKAGKFRIYCEEFTTNHTYDFMWIYVNDVNRFAITNDNITLYDVNGYARFNATATATTIKDASNVTRFNATATATEVLNAAGRKLLEASGVNTYLRSNGTADSYLQISDEEGHVYIGGVAKANWA
jgi:hypothetical protein